MKYNNEIDFFRTILIGLVILVHIVNFGNIYPSIKEAILAFIMPTFLVITGYLVNINKSVKDYVLYIKPANEKHFLTEFELSDKPYNLTFITPPAQWSGSVGVKGSFDPIVIGQDEYFVLGDNRISISDSRLWGSVPKQKILGRVILRYFPVKSFKFY